jgi:hemin uptake protein HemP
MPVNSGDNPDRSTAGGPAAGRPGARDDDAASPRVVNSAVLLDGRSQLAILHNETVYFLRQTRFGRLILTK